MMHPARRRGRAGKPGHRGPVAGRLRVVRREENPLPQERALALPISRPAPYGFGWKGKRSLRRRAHRGQHLLLQAGNQRIERNHQCRFRQYVFAAPRIGPMQAGRGRCDQHDGAFHQWRACGEHPEQRIHTDTDRTDVNAQ